MFSGCQRQYLAMVDELSEIAGPWAPVKVSTSFCASIASGQSVDIRAELLFLAVTCVNLKPANYVCSGHVGLAVGFRPSV